MSIALSLRAAQPGSVASPFMGVALRQGQGLPRELASLDRGTGGALTRALRAKDFRGNRDETMLFYGRGRGPARVLLIGLGTDLTPAAVGRAAAIAGRRANAMGVGAATFWSPATDGASIESVLVGGALGGWEYRDLKSPPPPAQRTRPLASFTLVLSRIDAAARSALKAARAVAAGQAIARTLGMMPGNLCTPDHIARTAQDVARRHKLKCTVRGRKEMEALGMNTFLAVARGTPQDPKFILLEYRGGKAGDAPIALVGKGLCFDSGGISIKPADRMEWMKYDMCGAAGVIGAMEAIAALQLPVNVVGAIGSTTNMPSGTAMNPGDVVKAYNGKTVEIINTDAEGRLVLADVLSFVAREYKPQAMVDAATLTGAVVVALGNIATGVLGTDQQVVDELLAAARRAGEPGWQLPAWPEYREQLKSDTADMRNIGTRGAGTITATMFLSEFIEGAPWGHLDVAGTAYTEVDLVAIGRGPTGVPVRTFVEFVRGRAR
ncbi:MAG TPA: leucyl aminopeptidase [Gemmatimonadaceae bacterium]|nr:leucyl aminopeptidase [Gemmatimonadaceae bacterium]